MILLPNRRYAQKPPLTPQINFGHPIAPTRSCWALNEGGGLRLFDAASKGCEASSDPTNPPTWSIGLSGPALKFNGTNQFAALGDPSNLNFVGDFTIAVIVRPLTLTNHQNIIWKGTATTTFGIIVPSTGLWQAQDTGVGATNVNGGTMVANTWYHLAVTTLGGTRTTYQDGKAQNSLGGMVQTLVSTSAKMGADTVNNRFFNGYIDSVFMWPRALTASEIMEHYQRPYDALYNTRPWFATAILAPSFTSGKIIRKIA